MIMRNLTGAALALALVAGSGCFGGGGGLGTFGAETGKKTVMGKTMRPPYTASVKYYGYVVPGQEPDAVVENKKMYFLYMWVPLAVAPELGVRMISPVPEDMGPEEGDYKAPTWDDNQENRTDYFDTWISFEKCGMSVDPEQIAEQAEQIKSAQWEVVQSNDDSSEMPKQPSGSNYNSLMRVTEVSKLTKGLYRIGFTTYKRGEVKGSFLAEVGALMEIPGVAIAKSLPELDAKLEAMDAEGAEGEGEAEAEAEAAE